MNFLNFTDLSGVARESINSVLIMGGAVLLSFLCRFIWSRALIPIASKTRTNLDRIILEATAVPLSVLILTAGFSFSVNRILFLEELEKSAGMALLAGIAYTLLVINIAFLVVKIFRAISEWYLEDVAHRTQTTFDEEFIPLLSRVISIIIFFIAATIILSHFKVNISGFLATAGIASLAIALAAQETLSNTISGFMLVLDKPFHVGDWIQLDSGEAGFVQEIGLRTTKILTFDNTVMIIPNAMIAKSKVVNRNYPDTKVKTRQKIGVAYGSDLVRVKKILLEICQAHPDVMKDPPPLVFFTEFGEFSLNLLLIYWVADLKEQFGISDQVNMEIKRRFEEENIEIPFPQRDIHMRK
ncbi:MAG: mechanosensitive ion channel domain-containing protein [Candidatus Omnitrophota bacterium]|nr:mechanosensitive ion channel [Candidatus Omnitrophota bacterium]